MSKNVLKSIQKQFPYVTHVHDATESLAVTVEERDAKAGRRKDGGNCALAKACKRQKIADAAIIGIGISYLITGETAVRYKTSQAVGREITSFDRHHDFAAGRNYLLSRISPKLRLGAQKHRGGKNTGKKGSHKRTYHRTANIRTIEA